MDPEFLLFFCGVLHYTNAHVLHKLRNILQIIPKITLIREWID